MNVRRNRAREIQEEQNLQQYIRNVEFARARIDQKAKVSNLKRCLNDQRREEEENARETQTKEHAALLKAYVTQEQQLATEVEEVRRSEINEKKQRQLLRQNSQELQELERQLRAAYVAKQQIAQIAEKEAIRLNEKLKEKQCNEILQSAWYKENEYRNLLKQEEIDRKAQYKQQLQDQMILEEKNRRFAYEEFLREKKMIDDIVQRIHEENEREIEERMCKMKKTQKEIDAFKEAQRVWQQKKREEIVEENRRIQEYLLSKASDEKAKLEAKQKLEIEKAKMSDEMAKKIYELQRQKREKEEIISQLMEEEQKEALEKRHRAEIEKQLRSRIEVRESLTRQMRDHIEQKQLIEQENAKYKEELLAKLAEDERLEQLSNENRRRKLLQIRKDVEKMIQDRRQLQAEQMQLQMRLLEDEKKEEAERKRLVQEERIRILQEHAVKLIGYMPKGVLQPNDLQYLAGTVAEAYGRKPTSDIK